MLARMTATQAKWQERVQAWRASGKTAEEYASSLDFEPSTLRYWSSRLKTESAAKPTMARVVRTRGRGKAGGQLPSDGAQVEIAIGGARIIVRRGFDAELLSQVARALGSVR